MLMIECRPPFQWKPSYCKFGLFKRFMWTWFAFTTCPYDINQLVEGIGKAGAKYYGKAQEET